MPAGRRGDRQEPPCFSSFGREALVGPGLANRGGVGPVQHRRSRRVADRMRRAVREFPDGNLYENDVQYDVSACEGLAPLDASDTPDIPVLVPFDPEADDCNSANGTGVGPSSTSRVSSASTGVRTHTQRSVTALRHPAISPNGANARAVLCVSRATSLGKRAFIRTTGPGDVGAGPAAAHWRKPRAEPPDRWPLRHLGAFGRASGASTLC